MFEYKHTIGVPPIRSTIELPIFGRSNGVPWAIKASSTEDKSLDVNYFIRSTVTKDIANKKITILLHLLKRKFSLPLIAKAVEMRKQMRLQAVLILTIS